MNFYIHENVNRLSTNSYIEELFIKGKLQTSFENNNGYPGDVYKEYFGKNLLEFVTKFSDLHFNDFLFMHGVSINKPTAKIVLMLLKYGSECLIYMDRSVTRWFIEGSINEDEKPNKDLNLQRKMRNIESFIASEHERLRIPQLKYNRIEKASKDGYDVNMAFNRFTRSRYPNSHLSGTLVEVNFFITKILPKINSKNSNELMEDVINIFKANNDYCTYLIETQRLDAVKLFLTSSRLSHSSKHAEEDDDDYDKRDCDKDTHPKEDSRVFFVKNTYKRQETSPLPISYEFIVADAVDAEMSESEIPENTDVLDGNNHNCGEEDDDDSDDSELDQDNIIVNGVTVPASVFGGYANGEDGDIFKNGNGFDILYEGALVKKEIIIGSLVYFIVKSTMSRHKDVLKQAQKIISSICLPSEVCQKFCVLLYFNVEKKAYHLMTRQVKTARGVLIQQNDILVCGWSGINTNFNKNLFFRRLKKKNKNYNIKKSQIFGLPSLDLLRNDLLETILEICKVDSGRSRVREKSDKTLDDVVLMNEKKSSNNDFIATPIVTTPRISLPYVTSSMFNYSHSLAGSESEFLNFANQNVTDSTTESERQTVQHLHAQMMLSRSLNTPSPNIVMGPSGPVQDVMGFVCSPAQSFGKIYTNI